MKYTNIPVRKETKKELSTRKLKFTLKKRAKVTWDEFLLEISKVGGNE